MAFIILDTGKARTLTHKQAVVLEKVKQGLLNGTPEQKAYAKRVKKIYFAKQHRPEDKPLPPVPDWWQK